MAQGKSFKVIFRLLIWFVILTQATSSAAFADIKVFSKDTLAPQSASDPTPPTGDLSPRNKLEARADSIGVARQLAEMCLLENKHIDDAVRAVRNSPEYIDNIDHSRGPTLEGGILSVPLKTTLGKIMVCLADNAAAVDRLGRGHEALGDCFEMNMVLNEVPLDKTSFYAACENIKDRRALADLAIRYADSLGNAQIGINEDDVHIFCVYLRKVNAENRLAVDKALIDSLSGMLDRYFKSSITEASQYIRGGMIRMLGGMPGGKDPPEAHFRAVSIAAGTIISLARDSGLDDGGKEAVSRRVISKLLSGYIDISAEKTKSALFGLSMRGGAPFEFFALPTKFIVYHEHDESGSFMDTQAGSSDFLREALRCFVAEALDSEKGFLRVDLRETEKVSTKETVGAIRFLSTVMNPKKELVLLDSLRMAIKEDYGVDIKDHATIAEAVKLFDSAIVRKTFVIAGNGLHVMTGSLIARAAAKFPNVALTIKKDNLFASANDIAGIVRLKAGPGDTIELAADGPKAKYALGAAAGALDTKIAATVKPVSQGSSKTARTDKKMLPVTCKGFDEFAGNPGNIRNLAREIKRAHGVIEGYSAAHRLGFRELPETSDAIIRDMKSHVASRIKAGVRDVVVIGIGGQYMTNKTLQDTLAPSLYNYFARFRNGHPRIHMLGNIDTVSLSAYLKDNNLDPAATDICLNSKSGDTVESAVNSYFFVNWLVDRLGEEKALEHMVVLTNDIVPASGLLAKFFEGKPVKRFYIPTADWDVGGRFSILAPTALISAAYAGIDIKKLLKGASDAKRSFGPLDTDNIDRAAIERNRALLMASYVYYNAAKNEPAKDLLVVSTFSEKLRSAAELFKQLFGESLGKNGKGIFPCIATGADSVNEFINSPQDKIFFFLNYLPEMTAAPRVMGHPYISIDIADIDEYTFGQLAYLCEEFTLWCGALFGIDPLVQPKVQLAKSITQGSLARRAREKERVDRIELIGEERLKNSRVNSKSIERAIGRLDQTAVKKPEAQGSMSPGLQGLVQKNYDFAERLIARTGISDLVIVGDRVELLKMRALYQGCASLMHNISPKGRGRLPRIHFIDETKGETIKALFPSLNLSRSYVLFVGANRKGDIMNHRVMRPVVEYFEKYGKFAPGDNHVISGYEPAGDGLTKEMPLYGLTSQEMTACAMFGLSAEEICAYMNGYRQYPRDISKKLAAYSYLFYDEGRDKTVNELFSYSNQLAYFNSWVKSRYRAKFSVLRHGPAFDAALGSTDQHSILEPMLNWKKKIFTIFVKFNHLEPDFVIDAADRPAKGLVPEYVLGHSMGELVDAMQYGVSKALTDDGRPNITINVPRLSPYYLGSLFGIFEDSSAYEAELLSRDVGSVSSEISAPDTAPSADAPAEQDMRGRKAERGSPIVRNLLADTANKHFIEITLEGAELKAHTIRYIDGYSPGVTDAGEYRGRPFDLRTVFGGEELENMKLWLSAHTIADRARPVKFRAMLGHAALGWVNNIEHSNISHAGVKDGAIYIGGLLLRHVMKDANISLREKLLDQDEFPHLNRQGHGSEEEYDARCVEVERAVLPINEIRKAMTSDNWKFLRNKLRSGLVEAERDPSRLFNFLAVCNEVSVGQPNNPIESRWPILRAVTLLRKEEQGRLVSVLRAHPETCRLAVVDSILLEWGRDIPDDWMEMWAPRLRNRTILQAASEIWYAAGGLGRVMEFHGEGINEILKKKVKREVSFKPDRFFSSKPGGDKDGLRLDENRYVLTYSGRLVDEKAGRQRALTDKNIEELVRMGVQVVIAGNVVNSIESKKLAEDIEDLIKRIERKDYAGKLIFIPRFNPDEQRMILAASDFGVVDSNPRTEAAGFSEVDYASVGAIVIVPPWPGGEGILVNQGVELDPNEYGTGNTLIPKPATKITEDMIAKGFIYQEPLRQELEDAYLDIIKSVIMPMTVEEVAQYQSTSIRLSRVLSHRLVGAEYLRQYSIAVEEKEIKDKAGKKESAQAPSVSEAPVKDLKGLKAPESNPLISQLIADGKVVEISLEESGLKAYTVKYADGYKPGEGDPNMYRGPPVDIRKIFNIKEEAEFVKYIDLHKVSGKKVKFRVAVDRAALGWNGDIDHANIAHAGYHDGVVYIGKDLLKRMFQPGNEALRKEVLERDEFMHLAGKSHGTKSQYEARFAMMKAVIRNLELRNTSVAIKVPDISGVRLKNLITGSPSIDEYYTSHKDLCTRIERQDELYAGKTTYFFRRSGMITVDGTGDTYKILKDQQIFAPDGKCEGSMLAYYHIREGETDITKRDNAITIVIRSADRDKPVIPGSDRSRGEEGWDEAVIKVYFDGDGDHISMIDYKVKPRSMNLSRMMLAILLNDAALTGELNELYQLLKEYLVFPDINESVRLREIKDNIPVPAGLISRANIEPLKLSKDDIIAIEEFANYKSWKIRELALGALRHARDAGKISPARFTASEALFESLSIEEDILFIKRFLIEKPALIGDLLSKLSAGRPLGRADVDAINIKWLGRGQNKNVYRIWFRMKSGESFNCAISTIRHNPGNPSFDRPTLNKALAQWERLSALNHRGVPTLLAYEWAEDFRPRMTDRVFNNANPEIFDENTWIANDINIIFRTFIEGDDLSWTLANPEISHTEKREIIYQALQSVVDIWNDTKDISDKGLFVGDPKPANIIVRREGGTWVGCDIDLDVLREFDGFDEVRNAVLHYPEYAGFDVVYENGRARIIEIRKVKLPETAAERKTEVLEPIVGILETKKETNPKSSPAECLKTIYYSSGLKDKTDIRVVAKAKDGDVTEDIPASMLQMHPNVSWILDEAAASAVDKTVGQVPAAVKADSDMEAIHKINMDPRLLPAIEPGKTLYLVIAEEFIPASASMLGRMEVFARETEKFRERIRIVKRKDLQSETAKLKSDSNNIVLAAVQNKEDLALLPKDVQALVFTGEDGGAYGFRQIEGIWAALRALYQSDTGALARLYKILTGKPFTGNEGDILKYINDPEALAGIITFNLEPAAARDGEEHSRLNKRLLEFLYKT